MYVSQSLPNIYLLRPNDEYIKFEIYNSLCIIFINLLALVIMPNFKLVSFPSTQDSQNLILPNFNSQSYLPFHFISGFLSLHDKNVHYLRHSYISSSLIFKFKYSIFYKLNHISLNLVCAHSNKFIVI